MGHKKWRVQTPFPTEVLTPTNVSAQCNGTASAHLHWDLKSRFLHNFLQYELQINKVGARDSVDGALKAQWVLRPLILASILYPPPFLQSNVEPGKVIVSQG